MKSAIIVGTKGPVTPLYKEKICMNRAKKTAMTMTLAVLVLTSTGFGSNKTRPAAKIESPDGTTQRVNLIKSGSAQQKAAAAFWLSQQNSLNVTVINSLV